MAKSAALLAAEAALDKAKTDHLNDLNRVFSALHREAENQGWCYQYTEFVEDIVNDLSVKPTEGVEKEYELDVLGHIAKVVAVSEEEAIEKLHTLLRNATYGGVLETD
jgi:hypothetical protein